MERSSLVRSETFGVTGSSWKGFEFDPAALNGSKTRQMTDLVRLLKSLKRRRFLDSTRGKPWTSFVPEVPAEKIPAASGLSNFLRITAGSFAISITTTLWDRREALHQARLADTITAYTPAYQQSLAHLHQFGMNDQSAAGAMAQSLVGQSYLLSSLDLFYLSAWLCVALIPLCFLVRRPAVGAAMPVAAD